MSPVWASLLVAVGGAAGALARFWVGALVGAVAGTTLPVATFAINVAGSLAIGVAAARVPSPPLAALLVTGGLGGFTTFSTFSLETVRLLEAGRVAAATLYGAGSAITCIAAAAAGLALGRAA
ncbi:fluoride efflux transporter CrcB [Acuticoccus sp.]|uniref:fluoride efflux transporter CrcB n=1 Tax=Acuticoccus sp. TaxID=1904378 RepID=UPI003B5173AD